MYCDPDDKKTRQAFNHLITDGAEFDFDMSDIARFREEFKTLIERLSDIFLRLKKTEKAEQRELKASAAEKPGDPTDARAAIGETPIVQFGPSQKPVSPEQELSIDSLTKTSQDLKKAPKRAAEANVDMSRQLEELKTLLQAKDQEKKIQERVNVDMSSRKVEELKKLLQAKDEQKVVDVARLETAIVKAEKEKKSLQTALDQAEIDKKGLQTALAEKEKKGLQSVLEELLEEFIPPKLILGSSVDMVTAVKAELLRIARMCATAGHPVPLRILQSDLLSKKDLQGMQILYKRLGLYPGLKQRSENIKIYTKSFITALHPPLPPPKLGNVLGPLTKIPGSSQPTSLPILPGRSCCHSWKG
jgi:hypothetical protein